MRELAAREREAEYAARWAAGAWRGAMLETARGERYHIVYECRRGGGAGPDFRDAVLARPDGSRLLGDIELHLRAGAWRAHGHERDGRYAHVVLHVVFRPLAPGAALETLLPAGGTAPIVVLGRDNLAEVAAPPHWPCLGLAQRIPGPSLHAALVDAGRARFYERADQLMRALAEAAALDGESPRARWSSRERVLWVSLAEALGYGRDRVTLRWAGEQLAEGADPVVIQQACAHLSQIERTRLDALVRLFRHWMDARPWEALLGPLLAGAACDAAAALPRALCDAARELSPARARIVTANVVLPFAAGLALLEGDAALRARALSVYNALPGLQSNTISRLMSRQIGLVRLPAGAAAQQGGSTSGAYGAVRSAARHHALRVSFARAVPFSVSSLSAHIASPFPPHRYTAC